MPLSISEIRSKYIEFFASRGHAEIPSASLVPENDPTTLFTGSGMQPLVQYLLGEEHPAGKRLVNSQKSFRAEDIDEVGDNRHTTFFEMLGNWSLGDYWKEDQLPWFFEFLTKELGLNPERLYVTVFSGDAITDIGEDSDSIEIWERVFKGAKVPAKYAKLDTLEEGSSRGMKPDERIFGYGAKKNWWSRAGVPENMPAGEPGGPDSEVFYDFDPDGSKHMHNAKFGAHCHPNCDCGRFLEIGNSVFMEYKKREDRTFEKLAQRNVDFGGGLERIAAASSGDPDIFRTDVFRVIIKMLENLSGVSYDDLEGQGMFRIVADHVRAASFIILDGEHPANLGRGYVLRRLLRRAIRYADVIGVPSGRLGDVGGAVADAYRNAYPEFEDGRNTIIGEINNEEGRFRATLEKGVKELRRMVERTIQVSRYEDGESPPPYVPINGKELFHIFSTYGFPLELSLEEIDRIRIERGFSIPLGSASKKKATEEFQKEFEKHQDLSRTATAGVFKGGLADHSEEVVRLHTATHLLNAALRKVLGDHVWQKGSNITKERTRFDFTHPAKMTDEEKKEVERLVNEWIVRDCEVKKEIMPYEEARKLDAIGVFGEKYAETVNVYTVWDPKAGEVVSREFCGGPHVAHTGEIGGKVRIAKEEAVSSGVRRIKAVIEKD